MENYNSLFKNEELKKEVRKLWLLKNNGKKKFNHEYILKIGYYTKVPMSYVQAAGKENQNQIKSTLETVIPNGFVKIQFHHVDNYEIDFLLENLGDELADIGSSIFAGAISAITSRAASQPFDVLKNKFQLLPLVKEHKHDIEKRAKPKHFRLLQIARIIYAERGIEGFFKGHRTSQLVGLFQNITIFGVYEHVRPGFQLSPIAYSQDACNFAGGLLAGFFAALVGQPLEVISVRQHTRRVLAQKTAIASAAKRIFETGGIRTFYRGTLAAVLHCSPLYGYKFMFYNWFCDHMYSDLAKGDIDRLEDIKSLGAGAMAGVLGNFIMYPMEMVKRLLLLDTLKRQRYRFDVTCRTITQCYLIILREDGILGFYKGLTPCLLRTSVNTAVSFAVYDGVRKWIDSV